MPNEPMDWVRVTDKDTGHKRTVRRQELAHGNYNELKQEAVDVNGDPLPQEFAESSATSGQSATTKKEQ